MHLQFCIVYSYYFVSCSYPCLKLYLPLFSVFLYHKCSHLHFIFWTVRPQVLNQFLHEYFIVLKSSPHFLDIIILLHACISLLPYHATSLFSFYPDRAILTVSKHTSIVVLLLDFLGFHMFSVLNTQYLKLGLSYEREYVTQNLCKITSFKNLRVDCGAKILIPISSQEAIIS